MNELNVPTTKQVVVKPVAKKVVTVKDIKNTIHTSINSYNANLTPKQLTWLIDNTSPITNAEVTVDGRVIWENDLASDYFVIPLPGKTEGTVSIVIVKETTFPGKRRNKVRIVKILTTSDTVSSYKVDNKTIHSYNLIDTAWSK